MFDKWFSVSATDLVAIAASAVIAYAAVLLYARLIGLRSFSKMSASDFAMTIACGSILVASISAPTPMALAGSFAFLCLFVGQWLIAIGRRKSGWFNDVIDNRPILLMAGSTTIDENLKRANVTRSDLFAKLRETNALNYNDVRAVVFERTGDVSVLHSDDERPLEPEFFANVIGAERLFTLGEI